MVTFAHTKRALDRIRDAVPPTPLLRPADLTSRVPGELRVKGELFHVTGSFKVRGALNWVRSASPEELDKGLVTVSAGNHASALAWAAAQAGASVTVVMPENASPVKVEATKGYGAEVLLIGTIHDALQKADDLVEEEGRVLVHPFNDPTVIAGAGTAGLEILAQLEEDDRDRPEPPELADVIVCPVGGGGLISGIGVAVKATRPDVRLVGVEPEGAPTLRRAWDEGEPVRLESPQSFAPSLGAAITGQINLDLSRRVVDDLLTLTDDEIRNGTRALLAEGKLCAEPGGAIGVAAILAGKVPVEEGERAVAVVTGGNVDADILKELL